MKKVFLLSALLILTAGCSADDAGAGLSGGSELVVNAADGPAARRPANARRGEILGEFSTEFTEKPENRAFNMKKAMDKLDGTIIGPGEEFSFNDALGPTNKAAGYKKAKIFVRGKDEMGYGGGICQVSSTLFNACDFAGMEINERHDHSKPVSYVEKGRDAATSMNGPDFRFTNALDFPVKIITKFEKTKITVSIAAA